MKVGNFNNDSLLFPPSWQYPEGIRKYDYIPNFAVRGLHYDIQKVIKKHKDAIAGNVSLCY